MKRYKNHPLSLALFLLVNLAAVITAAVVLFLLGYILWHGVPNLSLPGIFAWEYNGENQSMTPAIINTLIMTVLTLLLAVPVGVFAAIYLVEYAKKGSKLVKLIRVTAETLAGIPSIVYGLFGFIVFVITLGWSYTLIAGVITLSIMILPLIIRTTEGGFDGSSGFFQRRQLRTGSGKTQNGFPHCASVSGSGNCGRHYPCNRQNRRRIGGADFHIGNQPGRGKRTVHFSKYAFGTSVCSADRGSVHRAGICGCGSASLPRNRN